jgi:hypothetical protein
MIELETEHRKLNLFLFWNEHEDVFWKWMVNDHLLHLIYLIRSF